MLERSIVFRKERGIILMWCERDTPSFDDYIMGYFIEGNDGYYRFHPQPNIIMTCKHLREAAQKASELNIILDE